ncbi:hypothetical protein GS429_11960 [Natronorubrum sp. JWXQ-INN-674]|uniref:Uncharacterized protein n=1 Tax=Natronorubrum halalkaliphilum TaxID=2691917 RepID=A0A6B0VMR7_9EURY|nr:hypothetical protein [Natronorubrum halalkaliphilum]MXV62768.1 hypothetical protein [Natronorubrum halalkaliphilum]
MTGTDDETITRRPTVVLSAATIAAVLAAVLAIGAGADSALAFGLLGAVCLAAGVVRGLPTALDVGAVVLFIGVVVGGLEQTAVEPTVIGTIATVIAWDLGHSAVDLGEQLGRESRTARLEAVQIVSSLLVGLLSGTVGYAVYVVAGGGQPVAAAVLLLLAAVLITIGLGTQRGRSANWSGS